MFNRRHLITLLSSTALVACGSVPQPFRRAPNTQNPLLANPSGAGLGVLPPAGIDRTAASYIAGRIANDLKQQEIPAEAVSRTGILSFTADGNLSGSSDDGFLTTLSFNWRLLNRLGQVVTRLNQTVQVESAAWIAGDGAAHDRVAHDMAARLALLLAPSTDVERTPEQKRPWAGLTATIQRPETAPGDGAQSLGNAMANRLVREGFKPADGTPDIVLAAIVSMTEHDMTQDDIAIIWQVLDQDRQSMGEVRLDNRIPRGELDGAWGMIAEAVVDGAMPGLLEIISETIKTKR
ncbi:MAG: hypothetical protein OSB02_00760 [Rhodospirillaceae bacterium]|jgi:hypothetical protein|nr:hypothetical protein [Rhodospirillaceae bacterium]